MADLGANLGPGPIVDASGQPTQAFRAWVERIQARTGGLSGASTTDASGAAATAQTAAEQAQASAAAAQAAATVAQMQAQMATLPQARLALGSGGAGDFSPADFSPASFATTGTGVALSLQDMVVLTLSVAAQVRSPAPPDQSGVLLSLLRGAG